MQRRLFMAPVVMLAMPVQAQLMVAATASGSLDGTLIPPSACAQVFTVGEEAACVRAGSEGSFFQAFARTDSGGALRGTAYASGVAGSTSNTIGTAGASWTERVFFTPQDEPIFGFLEIAMSGVQSTFFAGSGMLGASTATFMQMGIFRNGDWDDFTARDEVYLLRRLDDYGSFQLHYTGQLNVVRGVDGPFIFTPVADTATVFPLTLAFELDPGTSFYDWNWRFAANALVEAGAEGWAFADYASTFRILSVGFRDSLGRDITRGLSVSFGSGASYPLSVIPEPATWALMIAGFGLAGAGLRRRRAQAGQVLPA